MATNTARREIPFVSCAIEHRREPDDWRVLAKGEPDSLVFPGVNQKGLHQNQ